MPQPRLLNPSGLALSIAIHLTMLTVGLGYAGVRPFLTRPVDAIAVDIVSPEEASAAREMAPDPPSIPDTADPAAAAAPAKPAKMAATQQQPQPAAAPVAA